MIRFPSGRTIACYAAAIAIGGALVGVLVYRGIAALIQAAQ